MRTVSAAHEALLATGTAPALVRVSVKDAGGTWRDLTSYGGVDWLDGVSVEESADAPLRTATLELKREVGELSIAPLMADSALNRAFDPANDYAAFLANDREIKVEAALGFEDGTAPEWLVIFHGKIDRHDPAAGESVVLECSDLGKRLVEAHIREERVYAFDTSGSAIKGLRIWKPNTAYEENELLLPTAGKTAGHYFRCTVAGTTPDAEPTWPTSGTTPFTNGTATFVRQGATSSVGKPVEAVMQSILNDTLGAGAVTLYTPESPGWNIRDFQQDRVPLLDALRALSDQIGWDVRYRWRAGTAQFELTFSEPDREKVTPDRTLGPDDYDEVTRLESSVDDLRDRIRVVYSDPTSLDADGNPRRKFVEVGEGERFGEFAEDATGNIDSFEEASMLAAALLSDLSEPMADAEASGPFLPFADLGDLYEYEANGAHFSTAQNLAVVALRHDFRGGTGQTALTLRGRVTGGGWKRWGNRIHNGRVGDRPPASPASIFDGTGAMVVTASAAMGGLLVTSLKAAGKKKKATAAGSEVHVSTSPGFIPSASTLVGVGDRVNVLGLEPGRSHYIKTIPRAVVGGRVERAEPTVEVEAVPSYLAEAHSNPAFGGGPAPANGNFESYFNGTGSPPDHWQVNDGEGTGWGTDARVPEDSFSGARCVEFTGEIVAQLVSAMFPVGAGIGYVLSARMKGTDAESAFNGLIAVDWYTRTGSLISTSSDTPALFGVTSWTEVTLSPTAPATATFARVRVGKDTDDDYTVRFDLVRLVEA